MNTITIPGDPCHALIVGLCAELLKHDLDGDVRQNTELVKQFYERIDMTWGEEEITHDPNVTLQLLQEARDLAERYSAFPAQLEQEIITPLRQQLADCRSLTEEFRRDKDYAIEGYIRLSSQLTNAERELSNLRELHAQAEDEIKLLKETVLRLSSPVGELEWGGVFGSMRNPRTFMQREDVEGMLAARLTPPAKSEEESK